MWVHAGGRPIKSEETAAPVAKEIKKTIKSTKKTCGKKITPKKVQQLQLEEKALVDPSEDWPRLPCFLLLPGSQQHDQGLTLLWRQLLATAEKAGQFGNSIQRNPAMLPI